MAARVVTVAHVVSITPSSSSFTIGNNRRGRKFEAERPCSQFPSFSSSSPLRFQQTATLLTLKSIIPRHALCIVACLPPTTPNTTFNSSTKLYVSVNLVMDRIANRPRGFAFLRYATEEESKKAIEGMHGKFLDGRVIFVEVAKPRSETRRSQPQNPRQY
ncbi:hypothetical protein LguiA_009225 [Lonicera macranthoides]